MILGPKEKTFSVRPAWPHFPDYKKPIQVSRKDNDKIKIGFKLGSNSDKVENKE